MGSLDGGFAERGIHARDLSVAQRFHIEDLIIQDRSGVVFRALHKETGQTVAVRRFFPFGPGGGGLDPDEQAAYNIAINRLVGLSHPALRSIIAGGCDPVDGIPFIATEWIEGDSLQSHLAQGPIPPKAVAVLITQALEVCELLSHALAEQAVWLETDLRTIIVSHPESGRGFTFWISPLKWLGGSTETKGLESIVTLTEEVMNWKGQIISDQAGLGLGGWLKWLRSNAATTTLQEAREALAASVGADPPPPVQNLVAAASPPVNPSPPKTLGTLALILILVAAVSASGWLVFRNSSAENPDIASPPAPPGTIEDVNRRAMELSTRTLEETRKTSAILAAQETATQQRGGVILWDDHELLVQNSGKSVIVEGVILEINKPPRGKTIYLLFSDIKNRNAARVGIQIGKRHPNQVIAQYKRFVGKKVRVSGPITVQKISGLNRPDIMIKNPSAVKIVE